MPADVDIKKKWIEAIRTCNNDEYSGDGLVCILHFSLDDMFTVGDRTRLKQNSIPSIFINLHEEGYSFESYHELISENKILKKTISKMESDFDSQQNENSKIISDLKTTVGEQCEELNKLQKKIKQLEVTKAFIEEKLKVFEGDSKDPNVS